MLIDAIAPGYGVIVLRYARASETVTSPSLVQIPRGHRAIWRGVDPAACESPLRAPRREYEQNGCVTLGSKPKVQTALG